MKTLLDVCKFLKAAGTYYLATVDCDKPRVRPFGTAHIYNGKLYIQTGKKKAVSHQIAANPNVEMRYGRRRLAENRGGACRGR